MRLDERLGDGTYNFSILTGSLRYMPPEVMLGRSYNDRADVYSFSIVLWEMIALERPYTCSNNSERQHKQRVCVENIRPPLKKFWSHGLQSTLRLGWDGLVQARSSMVEIKGLLEKEVR
jgi:serine/threonine protein kinase